MDHARALAVIKELCAAIELKRSDYDTHSLRRGGLHDAEDECLSYELIDEQAYWRHPSSRKTDYCDLQHNVTILRFSRYLDIQHLLLANSQDVSFSLSIQVPYRLQTHVHCIRLQSQQTQCDIWIELAILRIVQSHPIIRSEELEWTEWIRSMVIFPTRSPLQHINHIVNGTH